MLTNRFNRNKTMQESNNTRTRKHSHSNGLNATCYEDLPFYCARNFYMRYTLCVV